MSAGPENGASPEDWVHFDLTLGLARHLLPVAPPDAPIAAGSKLKSPGKVPSDLDSAGCAFGLKDWTTRNVTAVDVDAWSRDPRLGVCLRTGSGSGIGALDCDVEDAALSAEIAGAIADSLGVELPRRSRTGSAKFLLACRIDGDYKKRIIETGAGRIEWLFTGQQFVVSARHPRGGRYYWVGGLPPEIPTISRQQFETLWVMLQARFGTKPTEPERPTTPATGADAGVLTAISDADLTRLRDALEYPKLREAADDNDFWSSLGYSLLSLGTVGRELWLSFKRGGDQHENTQKSWIDQHRTQKPLSDYRHIFSLAHGLGWERELPAADLFPQVAPSATAFPENDKPRTAEVPEAHHLTTDQMNARRLHAAYNGQLFAHAGHFYAWNGTHWQRNEAQALRYAATLSSIVREEARAARERFEALISGNSVYEEVKDIGRKDQSAPFKRFAASQQGAEILAAQAKAEALEKWGRECEMAHRIESALRLLRGMLTVDWAQLDAHPHLLNCRNGSVDLRTGELKPHDPHDYITQCAPVAFNPAAECPGFDRFLVEILDQERAAFAQLWWGYCATGETNEQVLTLHNGQGANGKGVLTSVLQDVLGSSALGGYWHTVAPAIFVAARSADRHPVEVADLQGRRIGVASETEEGAHLRESLIKQITGGDALSARRLYSDFVTFQPVIKLNLLTNARPVIRSQNYAIWRRVILLDYGTRFGSPEDVAAGRADRLRDTDLSRKLLAEREGIFAWLVQGARQWYASGLEIPASVRAAGRNYQREQDLVAEFVRQNCTLDQSEWIAVKELFRSYQMWSLDSGYAALGRGKFSEELQRVVPDFKPTETRRKIPNTNQWRTMTGSYGLRLKKDDEPAASFDANDPVAEVAELL